MWESFKSSFVLNFVEDNRWKYLTDGLLVTLKITFFAVMIGILLGLRLQSSEIPTRIQEK